MRAFQAKNPVPHPALACLAAIYLVLCVPALPNEGGVYLGGVWPAHPACPVVVLGLTWWRWRCARTHAVAALYHPCPPAQVLGLFLRARQRLPRRPYQLSKLPRRRNGGWCGLGSVHRHGRHRCTSRRCFGVDLTNSASPSPIIHTAAVAAKSARTAHQKLHPDPSRMRETT